jgi:alpha-beta hydrolase superfamily lysophospholipase
MKDSARFFNDNQLAIYAYDQRGFGETQTRGRWSGSQVLMDDLATFIALIKETYPDTPLYILGDSMGGAVTILTMVRDAPPEIDGLILVAPAVWARSEMPFYQRFFLSFAACTIPWAKVTGESLQITPSDNIEMLKELGKDPLVIKETRIDVLYGLSNLMDKAHGSAKQLRSKLLLLYGEKDEIIPPEPVFSFYQRLPLRYQGQQRMILYEKGYHMLLRDQQGEVVMQDIVDWINDPAKDVSSL